MSSARPTRGHPINTGVISAEQNLPLLAMIDQVKIWVRSFYGTMSAAVRGLRELSLRLHYDSGYLAEKAQKLKDAEQRKINEKIAAAMRDEANHYASEAEKLERDLEAAMKKQPHDRDPK